MIKNYFKLIFCIFGCLTVGLGGSYFTVSTISSWYFNLNKPIFSPPNWLFGPVWTILYILMGISVWLIWKKGSTNKRRRDAIYLFLIQLILNGIWSPIFFGVKDILLALIIIVAMWIYILKTIKAFSKIDKTASFLLYPYLAWVSFATLLNFSIWLLNR